MNQPYINTVGRKKAAVARVRLAAGDGQITVNAKPIAEYFPGEIAQKIYAKPLEITRGLGKYAISAHLTGGGLSSQLGALVFGMARALVKQDAAFRPILKKAGFLTRDPRVKERRKYGLAQKARAKKQSPKR